MKKVLFVLLFPLLIFSQAEDIERYKIYPTENIYNSLMLDSATGQIWQLQIGVGDTDQIKTVLSDFKRANTLEEITDQYKIDYKYWEEEYNSKPDSIVSVEEKNNWKPSTVEERLKFKQLQQNGRFELYPTKNMYNFIMIDVIDGRSWQVQWSNEPESRLVFPFYE